LILSWGNLSMGEGGMMTARRGSSVLVRCVGVAALMYVDHGLWWDAGTVWRGWVAVCPTWRNRPHSQGLVGGLLAARADPRAELGSLHPFDSQPEGICFDHLDCRASCCQHFFANPSRRGPIRIDPAEPGGAAPAGSPELFHCPCCGGRG
jgi:hypothetical protein